jgi:septal ring factor EnvC (AmiA/AmiB activator)
MSLESLRQEALARRKAILNELEAEVAEEKRRLTNALKAHREAEKALRNAERAARNAAAAARNAAAAARNEGKNAKPKSVKTRKRHPGANYEIAGKPEYLAPGAVLRSVEGKKIHSKTLATTRGKRSKAKYQTRSVV